MMNSIRRVTRHAPVPGVAVFIMYMVVHLLLANNPDPALGALVDRVVAVINGQVITLSELEERARPILDQYLHDDGSPKDMQSKRMEILARLLPQLIDEYLVQQEVKKRGIVVSEQEVQRAIDRICKENSMSLDEFKSRLRAEGLSMEQYREQIRQQIERSKLIGAEVSSKIVVTDEQVRSYLEKNGGHRSYKGPYYTLDQICVTPSNPDDPVAVKEAKARAEKALEELKRGRPFAKVAKMYSSLPSAKDGGRLGVFSMDEMAPFVKKAVRDLKPGQFSDVIKTPMGWQILHLDKISRTGPRQEFSRAQIEDAREKLYRKQLNARFEEWLGELRSKSAIRILL